MAIRRQSLDELLLSKGADKAKVEDARTQAERAGLSLLGGIVRTKAVDDDLLAATLGEMTGLQVLGKVEAEQIDVDLVRQVPMSLARDQGVLPLWERDGVIEVALGSPSSMTAVDDFRVLFGKPVRPFIMAPGQLRDLINSAYDAASRTASAMRTSTRRILTLVRSRCFATPPDLWFTKFCTPCWCTTSTSGAFACSLPVHFSLIVAFDCSMCPWWFCQKELCVSPLPYERSSAFCG